MIAGLVTVAGLATPSSARASEPVSIYVVPSVVEQSAGTPARVAIHGAFVRLTNCCATGPTYSAPQCGVMYFQCRSGDETLCRMQWGELAAAAAVPSPTSCAGFGSLQVVSTATLRQEGAALGTPDVWDLGLGIAQGVYVDGQCPLALALACPAPGAADGGATDGATMPPGSGGSAGGGSTGSAGGSGVSGSGGGSGTGGATTIPGSGGATPATGGTAPPMDAGASGGAAGQPGVGGKGSTATPAARRSGCAVGGAVPDCPPVVAVAAVMAFGAIVGRRRCVRRRRCR